MYYCTGCGEVDRHSPPITVFPRMILNYRSEIMCEPCKLVLEEFLLKKWGQWILEMQKKAKDLDVLVEIVRKRGGAGPD